MNIGLHIHMNIVCRIVSPTSHSKNLALGNFSNLSYLKCSASAHIRTELKPLSFVDLKDTREFKEYINPTV